MRKTVLILLLSMATMTVAYGQVVELPPATTSPVATDETQPAVPREPAVAEPIKPVSLSPPEAAIGRRVLPDVPPYEVAMTQAAPARRAVTTKPSSGHAHQTPVPTAYKFTVVDVEKNARYGPFTFKHEGRITLGGAEYVLLVEEASEVGEVKKSPEQLSLENKLRKSVISDINLKDSSIMEAVDLLATMCDVNIVVTEVVQKSDLSITLTLRYIPLYDAIRYVAEVADIGFRIDDHAVVITDKMPPQPLLPAGLPSSGR